MSPEPVDDERSLPVGARPCVCWPSPSGGAAALHLVLDVASDTARAVRAAVREWSARAGLGSDTVDAVVLAVDEAVTNVVDHAHMPPTGVARTTSATCGRVEVTVSGRPCGNGVAVSVVDDGSWLPPPADPGHRGRGIQVIGGLAGRSTVVPAEHGTTVRMCWETPGGEPACAGHD